MIFGLSDSATTALIVGGFGTFTSLITTAGLIAIRRIDIRSQETAVHITETKNDVAETKVKTAELARSIDGMKEELVKAAVKEGRQQVKDDIKLGAELAHAKGSNGDPLKVSLTNGEPEPVKDPQ